MLTERERETLERNLDTALGYTGFDLGTIIFYLEKAVHEDSDTFRNSIDRIYNPHLMLQEKKEQQLAFIEALMSIHKIYNPCSMIQEALISIDKTKTLERNLGIVLDYAHFDLEKIIFYLEKAVHEDPDTFKKFIDSIYNPHLMTQEEKEQQTVFIDALISINESDVINQSDLDNVINQSDLDNVINQSDLDNVINKSDADQATVDKKKIAEFYKDKEKSKTIKAIIHQEISEFYQNKQDKEKSKTIKAIVHQKISEFYQDEEKSKIIKAQELIWQVAQRYYGFYCSVSSGWRKELNYKNKVNFKQKTKPEIQTDITIEIKNHDELAYLSLALDGNQYYKLFEAPGLKDNIKAIADLLLTLTKNTDISIAEILKCTDHRKDLYATLRMIEYLATADNKTPDPKLLKRILALPSDHLDIILENYALTLKHTHPNYSVEFFKARTTYERFNELASLNLEDLQNLLVPRN